MKEPLVFILILNWKSALDTIECVESVEKSDYTNYKIVIIDNGSPDDSEKILCGRFPQHHFIQTGKNLGYAGGNNIGIRFALERQAEFVLILNNDAILAADVLQIFIGASLIYSQGGIFAPKIYDRQGTQNVYSAGVVWDPKELTFVDLKNSISNQNDFMTPKTIDFATGCALFIKTEVFQKVGLFDPRFFLTWEDIDYCYQARKYDYQTMIIPQAKVWHKLSASFEGGHKGPQFQYYSMRNRFLWVEKNLKGSERIKVFFKFTKDVYTTMRALCHRRVPPEQTLILKSGLLGAFDYVIRHFGVGRYKTS